MLMTQIGGGDVVRYLISLLSIGIDKVKCQSCLALRNLASDGERDVNASLNSSMFLCRFNSDADSRGWRPQSDSSALERNRRRMPDCRYRGTSKSIDP